MPNPSRQTGQPTTPGASKRHLIPVVLLGVTLLSLAACDLLPHNAPLFDKFVPESVAMLSPDEGWVVGEDTSRSPAPHTAALHYHGGQWTRMSVPTIDLKRVFAVAPDDVWALSTQDGVFHYNGSTWTRIPIYTIAFGATDLYMFSATEGWVVGLDGILRLHNGQWTRATDIVPAGYLGLHSISMDSPSDGWAVGYNGMLLHYDGSRWTREPAPYDPRLKTDAVSFSSVWMLSASDGWAISASGILHYVNGSWAIVDPEQSNAKYIVMLSATDGWAAGFELYHLNSGQWKRVTIPNGDTIRSLSFGSPTDGWAVGGLGLLHYHNGVWTEPLLISP